MEENEVKAESYIPLSKELKEKRKLMGLKSNQVHSKLGIEQGNYSRMENAMLNPESAMPYIRKLFSEWKKEKIKSLKAEIKKLENIQ